MSDSNGEDVVQAAEKIIEEASAPRTASKVRHGDNVFAKIGRRLCNSTNQRGTFVVDNSFENIMEWWRSYISQHETFSMLTCELGYQESPVPLFYAKKGRGSNDHMKGVTAYAWDDEGNAVIEGGLPVLFRDVYEQLHAEQLC